MSSRQQNAFQPQPQINTVEDDLDVSEWAWRQFTASEQEAAVLREHSSLPENSWEEIDDTVYRARLDTLTVLADLRDAGLTSSASIYSKDLTWTPIDRQGSARISMDPETHVEEGTVGYSRDGTVLPIIHGDFSLGMRDRPNPDNPYSVGPEIDTLGANVTSRAVNEVLEQLTLTGWPVTFSGSGYATYGLTNHPHVNNGDLTDWNASVSDVRKDIRKMVTQLKDENFRPGNTGYWLYLSDSLEDIIEEPDPEGDGNLYIRDRIEDMREIDMMKPAEFLPEDSALLFRPTEDVIDIGIAEDLQTVQWQPNPFRDKWKIMASLTPKVKSMIDGGTRKCGIAYWTIP
jgi:hypothetical protein